MNSTNLLLIIVLSIPTYFMIRSIIRDGRKIKQLRRRRPGPVVEQDDKRLGTPSNDELPDNEATFAVLALKQRLNSLYNTREKYESDDFFVETQRVGRILKIKWRFKPDT